MERSESRAAGREMLVYKKKKGGKEKFLPTQNGGNKKVERQKENVIWQIPCV